MKVSLVPKSRLRLIVVAVGFVVVGATAWYLHHEHRRELKYRFQALLQYPYFPPAERAFDFTVDFYGLTYVGNSGNMVDGHVLYLGAYEKPVLYFLRDVASALGGKHWAFVDVGANTGQHSLFMSRLVKEVHAFEPYERVLKQFREMVRLNKLTNIVIHPVGLGRTKQKVPFFEPPSFNLGKGTFVEGFSADNSPSSQLKLQIVRGDDALREAAVGRVGLIKVDVEGYERPVLEGLKRTLSAHRPIVVLELNATKDGFNSREELESTFPQGYRFFVFRRDWDFYTGAYELRSFRFTFDPDTQDMLVACPEKKLGRLPRRN